MDRLTAMETFVHVVETGSFSSAAKRMGIGQPAVSKGIAQLEARLAVRLLMRSTRGLTPTEAGLAFFEKAKRAVDDANDADDAARGASNGLSGTLRISAGVTFCRLQIIPNLEPAQVNGKDALIRTDIDYDQKDEFGKTNLERMKLGKPPLDADGNPIELHHIGQKSDAPLAELTRGEHRGNGNDNVLHDKLKESEINREDFGKERKEYWKARAEAIENQRGAEN